MGKKRDRQWRREQKRLRKIERKNRKRFTFREGRKNRHHIVNKCRGGDASIENLLIMDVERHNAFHFLFRNMSFLQVIKLLIRCLRMKNHADYDETQQLLEEFEHESELHKVPFEREHKATTCVQEDACRLQGLFL